jgi:hypothetical protein
VLSEASELLTFCAPKVDRRDGSGIAPGRLSVRTNTCASFVFVLVYIALLNMNREKITARLPAGGLFYGSLPIIALHSSFVNARSVFVRTFPAEPSAKPNDMKLFSSGASMSVTMSYSPNVQ